MADHSKIIANFEAQGEAAIRKWLVEHVEENSSRVEYRLARQWLQDKESLRAAERMDSTSRWARHAAYAAYMAAAIAAISIIITMFHHS